MGEAQATLYFCLAYKQRMVFIEKIFAIDLMVGNVNFET